MYIFLEDYEINMKSLDIPGWYLHFYLPVFSPRKSAPGRPGRKVKDLGSECTRQNKATRCQGRSYPSAWMDAAGAEGWGSKAQVLSSNILRGEKPWENAPRLGENHGKGRLIPSGND